MTKNTQIILFFFFIQKKISGIRYFRLMIIPLYSLRSEETKYMSPNPTSIRRKKLRISVLLFEFSALSVFRPEKAKKLQIT